MRQVVISLRGNVELQKYAQMGRFSLDRWYRFDWHAIVCVFVMQCLWWALI